MVFVVVAGMDVQMDAGCILGGWWREGRKGGREEWGYEWIDRRMDKEGSVRGGLEMSEKETASDCVDT